MRIFLPAVSMLLVSGLTAGTVASIRIVENTSRLLSFVWEMDDYSIDEIRDGSTGSTRLTSPHANTDIGESGDFILPARSFYIGVPRQGMVQAAFTALETEVIPLEYPPQKRSGDTSLVRRPELHFTDPYLSDARSASMGRFRTHRYFIRPFLYDEATGMLRVVKRGSCRIVFPDAPLSPERPAPRSDYYASVSRLLLNFSTASRWIAPPVSQALRKKTASAFPLGPDRQMIQIKVGDGRDGVREGTIDENGIMKIAGSAIVSMLGGGILVNRVALYASRQGELERTIPPVEAFPAAVSQIPLLAYDLNGNGKVDIEDYFLCFVTGGSDWRHDAAASDYSFGLNRYDDYRTYWITALTSGTAARMERFSPDVAGPPDRIVAHHENRVLLKGYSGIGSYPLDRREGTIDWIWQRLTRFNNTMTHTFMPVGANPDSAAFLRLKVQDYYDTSGIDVFVDSRRLPLTPDGYRVDDWGNGAIKIELNAPYDSLEIAHFEIRYRQNIHLGELGKLIINSPPDSSAIRYTLTGIPAGELVYVIRVPRDERAISLVDTVRGDGVSGYAWSDSGGRGIRYVVSTEGGFVTPAGMEPYRSRGSSSQYAIRDLHATSNRADYLIVYHVDFEPAARGLAEHKKTHGGFLYPKIAEIGDVYREFSGGNVDPAALRDFLFYAKNMWDNGDRLDYVLLMGAGHWDYKKVMTKDSVYIPVAQTGQRSDQRCIEDFFADLGGDKLVDVILGRIPCRSLDEAQRIVGKIIEIEDPAVADYGPWRNRVLLVADDDMQANDRDRIVGAQAHHVSSEKVSLTIESLQPSIDMRKVYLFEYPMNDQYEKPAATQAIINEINNGVCIVNYFGHGADNVWADEHVLTTDDVARFGNAGRYPLINSFSCSVGKFDDPRIVSLSEHALLAENSRGEAVGAIATISSTRQAWATQNEMLAESFFRLLMNPDTVRTIGQAYIEGRAEQSTESLRAYALLGDPAIRYVNPTHGVRVDIYDAGGRRIDTLMALQRIVVKGTVRTQGGTGAADTRFGTASAPAFVQIGMYNPPDTTMRKDGLSYTILPYALPGVPLFSGKTVVNGGEFEQTILLPRNVAFEKDGTRLTAYAWKAASFSMGRGIDTAIVFSGTAAVSFSDTTGPVISVRPVYDDPSLDATAGFTDLLCLTEPLEYKPAKFEIHAVDENGIDIVGVGPDEGLTIEIPGVLNKKNINNMFQFINGDFRQGKATCVFEKGQIHPGLYTIHLSAQDLLGNRSGVSIDLEVVREEEFRLSHVFNYPNPMRMGYWTDIYFHPSRKSESWDRVDVILKIYTLRGKLLYSVHNPPNPFRWYGVDRMGNDLGPNIYLYRITAWAGINPRREYKSDIRKIVIHPPRGK